MRTLRSTYFVIMFVPVYERGSAGNVESVANVREVALSTRCLALMIIVNDTRYNKTKILNYN